MAYIEMVNGFSASLYMSEKQIEDHAKRFSKSYSYDKAKGTSSSKWSDPLARPAMAKKTVLKGLLGTYGLMTTEFAKGMASDSDEADHNNGARYEEADIVYQPEPETQQAEIIEQGEPTETEKPKFVMK